MKTNLEAIKNRIDVWHIRLSDGVGLVNAHRPLLSEKEAHRAENIVDDLKRNYFILSRALLRRLLASYLDITPDSLHFLRNPNGKPFLEQTDLEFNISHSQDQLLIAITRGQPVGIDLEPYRDIPHRQKIATRWFSEPEQSFLSSSSDPQSTFFEIWSKKEAFVKANGASIFQHLNAFTVPLGDDSSVSDGWFFQTLDVSPDVAAAVVSKEPQRPIQVIPYRFELDKNSPTFTL